MSAFVQRRARPDGAGAAAFLQHRVDVGLRDVQRRGKAEEDPGSKAHGRDEEEDGAVHRELNPRRLPDILRRLVEQPNAHDRQQISGHAADGGEHDALDEQLPDDPHTRRAERHANADFPRTVRRSGEQQVGDVRARDEQHEAHCAHQGQEDQSDRPAVLPFAEGHQHRRNALVRRRVLRREPGGNGRQLGKGLVEAHAWGEAPERLEAARAALERLDAWRQVDERHPEVVVVGKLQPLGHHADDGRQEAVDRDGAPDDRRVTPVAAAPDVVADEQNGRRAGHIVFRPEVAPQDGLLADQAEDIGADVGAGVAIRYVPGVAQVEAVVAPDRQALERFGLAPVLEVGQ